MNKTKKSGPKIPLPKRVIFLLACALFACSSGQTAQTVVVASAPENETSPGTEAQPAQGPYSLQIGSFERPDEAAFLIMRLKRKGYDAYQKTEQVPSIGEKYRVRLGHFSSREQADKFAENLKKKEGLDSYICIDLE
jgi:cell division septation protein DedD